ncbi:MAG: hypothetical protein ACI4JM_03165, partial [Oscillospiraceae bacterium]
PAFFQKSWWFPKAEPLVARTSETGVRGRQPLPLKAFKKVFWQPFYKKRLGGFQPLDEIFSKL